MNIDQIKGLKELLQEFMNLTEICDQIYELEDQVLNIQKSFKMVNRSKPRLIYLKTFAEFKDFILNNLPAGTQIKKSLLIEMFAQCMIQSKSLSLCYLSGGSKENKLKGELVSAAFKCLFESHPLDLYNFRKNLTKNQLEKLHSKHHDFYMNHFKFDSKAAQQGIIPVYSKLEHEYYMKTFEHCASEYEWELFYNKFVINVLNDLSKLQHLRANYNFPQKYMEIIEANIVALKLSV